MDSDLRDRIAECLHNALDADDPSDMAYHIRQALQLLDTSEVSDDAE